MGPLNGNFWGLVTSDATRVYWTYAFTGGQGSVASVLKATPQGSITSYGTMNKNPLGVAVDSKNLYWTNGGTGNAAGTSDSNGELVTCPIAGCAGSPTLLAPNLPFAGDVVFDAKTSGLYFLASGTDSKTDGAIYRIATP